MASKKAGRLAGLAALAGLAYMANEKSKGAKDTAAANAREEENGPASKSSEEAKKPFKGAMFEKEPGPYLTDDKAMYEKEPGFETKTTPAKVASPSASVAKTPMIGGPTPARDPGGAGKRGAVSPGPNPVRDPGGVGKRGGVGDGGQSMVERQNAGAKRAGLSVDDYIASGKKTIDEQEGTFNRGGKVKKMASGGMISSASKRGDGIATKGKTRGRMC